MTHSNQQRAWALKPLPQLSPKPPRNTHTLIQISTKPKRFPTVNSANSPKLHREGPARTTTKLRRPSPPSEGAQRPILAIWPSWEARPSVEAREAVRRPAAHARCRRAGPALPGARAGLRPGPSPRRAARARTMDAPSLRLRGREQGTALPGPRRRLTRKDVRDRVPAPGQTASSSRCSSGGSAGDRDGGPELADSAAVHGRRTHRAPPGGPRQVLTLSCRDTLPPPLVPWDSARSSRRRRRRRRRRRAPGARAPHRSLRASTYRAARGRGERGRGARPKPSNPLTRECRSQSRGQLRAAPTGSPRDARFCLRRPPRSAPHPRTGPAPVRAAPLIGPPRPHSKGHAPILEIPPAASPVCPRDTPRPVRVARREQDWGDWLKEHFRKHFRIPTHPERRWLTGLAERESSREL
ncbi:unnamed protein product [Rangifer tarandus platyrhynchus]|uniref:Uncharacterized protein n=1 Tax=Rangifer tarandus platyrhynchus TaxID=3082113 RepID=A0ABN8YGM0_RANTA|nr:unnamed protein product [Rangifer tarandus platyrhynchus]